jgi:hypothetical protein
MCGLGEGNYSQRSAVHSDIEFLTVGCETAAHLSVWTCCMEPEGSSAEQWPSLHPNFSPVHIIASNCPRYIIVTQRQGSSVNKVISYILDNQHSIPGSSLLTSSVKMEAACSSETWYTTKRLCGAVRQPKDHCCVSQTSNPTTGTWL